MAERTDHTVFPTFDIFFWTSDSIQRNILRTLLSLRLRDISMLPSLREAVASRLLLPSRLSCLSRKQFQVAASVVKVQTLDHILEFLM